MPNTELLCPLLREYLSDASELHGLLPEEWQVQVSSDPDLYISHFKGHWLGVQKRPYGAGWLAWRGSLKGNAGRDYLKFDTLNEVVLFVVFRLDHMTEVHDMQECDCA